MKAQQRYVVKTSHTVRGYDGKSYECTAITHLLEDADGAFSGMDSVLRLLS